MINAQISGPSGAAAGAPVLFSTSAAGSSYNWTVSTAPRNMDPTQYTPVSATVVASLGFSPNYCKMVFDGTNWYSFTVEASGGRILQAFYGTDPRNASPVVTPLTTKVTTNAGNETKSIDVVYDSTSSKWYIFVAHSWQTAFYKLTMGTSGLADLNPAIEKMPLVTSGGSSVNFHVTDQLVVKKYNGEWLAFVGGSGNPGGVDANGNDVSGVDCEFLRLDLGSSLAALSSSTNLVKQVLNNRAKYFSLYREGSEWFAFASRGATSLSYWRTDFGADLKNNAPASVNLTGSITGTASTRSVLLFPGCNNELYGYVMSSLGSGGWRVFDFKGSIKNTPVLKGTVSPVNFPMSGDGMAGVSPFVYGDTLYAVISGWGGGNRLFTVKMQPLTGSETRYYSSSYQHTFAAPGTYTVNVLVDHAAQSGPSAYCHTVNVSAHSGPAVPGGYTAAPDSVCQGQQAVIYAVPPVSGATAYHWHYTGSGAAYASSTATSSNTVSFNGSATGGILRVWAVDNNGDSSTSPRDTTITVITLPVVSISPVTVAICAGQSATLTASGATTYSWSPSGGSNASATVSPGTTTSYTVTGTSSGCSATATRQVMVTPLPVVSISPATVAICAGQSATLTASGATTYSWSPSGGSNASATVSPGTTMSYTVTGTSSGCSATATRQVTVTPLPVTQITVSGSTDICLGDTVRLSASGSGYTYSWKNGSGTVAGSGSSYGVYATGSYKVVAADPVSGCSDSTQEIDIRVYAPPAVSLDQNDTSFCIGGVILLEVETRDTGLTYVWQHNAVDVPLAVADFLEIRQSGVYRVIVGRAHVASCEDSTNEVMVTVHPLPVVDVTWDNEQLHATPGYVSYQWNTGNQGIAGETDSTFTPSSNGGYSVTVRDSNGCENTSAVRDLKNVKVASLLPEAVSVYPNPSGGMVYIGSPVRVDVLLLDVDGRILQRVEDAQRLDLGGYADGVYLLRITDAEGMVLRYERVIKQ